MLERPDNPLLAFSLPPGASLAHALKNSPLDAVDTRILVMHALKLSRIQLITQSERILTTDEAARLSSLLQRRLAGEPVAYIIGEREFYGLTFKVTPDVLIPRPETELLVDLAIERLPSHGRALDMGTGSGAIAVSLAVSRPDAHVTALDLSSNALRVAAHNAAAHHARIDFLQSDWYASLPQHAPFALIASNPPYIVSGDPHLSSGDLRFEPVQALTDHADGLSAFKAIVSGAPTHLVPGGWLLMEHGYDQAAAVRRLLDAYGFSEVQSWTDLAGIERVSGGTFSL